MQSTGNVFSDMFLLINVTVGFVTRSISPPFCHDLTASLLLDVSSWNHKLNTVELLHSMQGWHSDTSCCIQLYAPQACF